MKQRHKNKKFPKKKLVFHILGFILKRGEVFIPVVPSFPLSPALPVMPGSPLQPSHKLSPLSGPSPALVTAPPDPDSADLRSPEHDSSHGKTSQVSTAGCLLSPLPLFMVFIKFSAPEK